MRRWRTLISRGVVIAAGLLFVTVLIVAGDRLQREQELQLNSYRTGSWVITSAEMELLRLQSTIRRRQLEDTPAATDEMWLQFDIFWSRIPLMLEGEESAGVRELDGVVETFTAISDSLPRWERMLQRGVSGRPEQLGTVVAELEDFRTPIHDAVIQTLVIDETVYNRERLMQRFNQLYGLFFILCLAGVVVVLLLLRQLRQSARLAQAAGRSEKEAQAARRRIVEVIDSVDAGITYVNRDGEIEYVNDGYRRIFPELALMARRGVRFTELLRRKAEVRVVVSQMSRNAWLADRLDKASAKESIFEQHLKDGRTILVREKRTADGGVVSVRTDITAVREQQRALEDRLEAIEASSDGIAITDDTGRFVYLSPSYARMQGLEDPSEVLGRTWRVFFDENERERLAREGLATLQRTGEWRGEASALRRDGQSIPLEIYCKRIHSGGFVAAVRDLTEVRRQQAEREALSEQFFRAQKMEALGRMAGGIAHDFNNILGAIQGFGALLQEDLSAGTPERDFADSIVRAGEHGKELVQQILAFARTEAVQKTDIEINELLAETGDMLRASLSSATTLTVQQPEADFVVAGNRTQLSQVLVNLCLNANDALDGHAGRITVDASVQKGLGTYGWDNDDKQSRASMRFREGPEPGRVRVWLGRLSPEISYLCISVADDGQGITRAVAERMFDPFFTTKDRGKGTGLGLAAIQGIVSAHEGGIAVDSAAGSGAVFRVYLPVSTATTAAAGKPLPAPEPKNVEGGHLLLVDDEEAVGTQLAIRLERLGYDVTLCQEPEDALAACLEAPDAFDAVITDFSMPGMTGRELAGAILARSPLMPVIVCTGHIQDAEASGLDELPLAAVLRKPVDFAALTRTIRQCLENGAAGSVSAGGRSRAAE